MFAKSATWVWYQSRSEGNDSHGWHLIHVSKAHFYIFERGLPEKVVYQLDFAGTSKDYLQLYQDYGWQYCGSCDNWNYFRKPQAAMNDPIDSQLFSDQDSKRLFVQKIVIWRILPIVLFLAIQFFMAKSLLQWKGVHLS